MFVWGIVLLPIPYYLSSIVLTSFFFLILNFLTILILYISFSKDAERERSKINIIISVVVIILTLIMDSLFIS